MHVLARDFVKQKLLYSVRTPCLADQNCNFLYQFFRLPNVHDCCNKVHRIGDVFYNLTFNKLHAAGSSLSTQVMTTQAF